MKTKPKNKYPQWLVKRKITSIRNRYVRYIKSINNIPEDDNVTWADCWHKAQGKLAYRFNNLLMGSQENDDWMVLIAFIKARLVQHFDDNQAWRITEYNALERVNKQDFLIVKAPNLIWHHIAVDKAGRANKILKRKHNSRPRTDKYDWEDVICNSKIRINNSFSKETTEEEMFWSICLKANVEKIRSRIRWLDWNSAIHRNYLKMRRMSKSEI